MKKKLFCCIVVVVMSVVLTACGGSKIAPAQEEIELGSDVNMADLVTYNTKKVAFVLPAENSAIDTNTVGTYDVTYDVVTVKGKESTQTVTFSVVDTTPPEFINCQDSIYLIKGTDFIPDDHITVSDLSGETVLSYTGELDTAVAGEFPVTISAVDASGNKAEKEVAIIIEDRTPDIRNAVFGDSKEQIMRYETAQFEGEYSYDNYTELWYSTTIANINMNILYYINNNGEFYEMCYISQDDDDFASMKSDYDDLKEMLDGKYETGTEQVIKKGLYKYCSSNEQAFNLGYLGYRCVWLTERMSVVLALADDILGIIYESTEYTETLNSSGL